MTDHEYDSAWMIAASLWPSSKAPQSARVRQAWRRPLERFAAEDVFGALEELSLTRDHFPSLAVVIGACRELLGKRIERERLRLTAAPTRSWHEQGVVERLREFDRAAAEMRAEHLAEGMRPEVVTRVGPFERRARALMAGEIEPGSGLAEFFATAPEAKGGGGPVKVGAVIGQLPMGDEP